MKGLVFAILSSVLLAASGCGGGKEAGGAAGGGSATSLAGTGWIIYRNGQRTGQNMLFCNSGRWEVVPPEGIGPSGRWQQSGTSVTITPDNSPSEDWQVHEVSAQEIELRGSSGPVNLRERGPTTC